MTGKVAMFVLSTILHLVGQVGSFCMEEPLTFTPSVVPLK